MAKPIGSNDETESSLATYSLSSCLKRTGSRQVSVSRSVSFPEDESQIVTGYLEPVNPWLFAESTTKDDVLSNYIKSCEKHGVTPIRKVLDLLEELSYSDGERVKECLNLKGEQLLLESCEALEEVLKRVQFEKINVEDTGLDDEAAVALFDMIEYYEAASHLNVSKNLNIGHRGWQSCSRMLKRAKCLELFECKNTPWNESLIPLLSRALRLGSQLQVLKLENCSLAGRPIVTLAASLRLNTTLKELYLAENNLTFGDAAQLAGLIRSNTTLQLLDVSNNCLEDRGVEQICDALYEKCKPSGLSILILWNNQLKTTCSPHINRVLRTNSSLEMLNIGHNELKDEFLQEIKEALIENKYILRLGMQSTNITSDGAGTLAQIISENPTIQRVDLRDNDLQVKGLLALAAAMKSNTSITQLDIDDCPRTKLKTNGENDGELQGDTMEKYMKLVEEMRGYCSRNENGGGEDAALRSHLSLIAARKISLTCDTTINRLPLSQQQSASFLSVDNGRKTCPTGRLRSPAPSPIPSPVASPSPTRTRFQVSKVSESSSTDNMFFGGNRSRFKVTTVSDAPSSPSPLEEPKPAVTPPPVRKTSPSNPPPETTPPRTRKLSAWMNPGIFVEAKAASGLERLLGLFQNPFGVRSGEGGGNDQAEVEEVRRDAANNNPSVPPVSVTVAEEEMSGGATWPQTSVLRPTATTPVQSATSAPSLTALAVIKPTG